jgi:exonuclease III
MISEMTETELGFAITDLDSAVAGNSNNSATSFQKSLDQDHLTASPPAKRRAVLNAGTKNINSLAPQLAPSQVCIIYYDVACSLQHVYIQARTTDYRTNAKIANRIQAHVDSSESRGHSEHGAGQQIVDLTTDAMNFSSLPTSRTQANKQPARVKSTVSIAKNDKVVPARFYLTGPEHLHSLLPLLTTAGIDITPNLGPEKRGVNNFGYVYLRKAQDIYRLRSIVSPVARYAPLPTEATLCFQEPLEAHAAIEAVLSGLRLPILAAYSLTDSKGQMPTVYIQFSNRTDREVAQRQTYIYEKNGIKYSAIPRTPILDSKRYQLLIKNLPAAFQDDYVLSLYLAQIDLHPLSYVFRSSPGASLGYALLEVSDDEIKKALPEDWRLDIELSDDDIEKYYGKRLQQARPLCIEPCTIFPIILCPLVTGLMNITDIYRHTAPSRSQASYKSMNSLIWRSCLFTTNMGTHTTCSILSNKQFQYPQTARIVNLIHAENVKYTQSPLKRLLHRVTVLYIMSRRIYDLKQYCTKQNNKARIEAVISRRRKFKQLRISSNIWLLILMYKIVPITIKHRYITTQTHNKPRSFKSRKFVVIPKLLLLLMVLMLCPSQAQASKTITIVTKNIQGATEDKRRELENLINHLNHPMIICIQEPWFEAAGSETYQLKQNNAKKNKKWPHEKVLKIQGYELHLHAPDSSQAKLHGIATLFHASIAPKVKKVWSKDDWRAEAFLIHWSSRFKILLCNVHAPSDTKEAKKFWKDMASLLKKWTQTYQSVIVAGDMNALWDSYKDRRSNAQYTQLLKDKAYLSAVREAGLTDLWRAYQGNETIDFTRLENGCSSRLDTILGIKSLMHTIQKAEIIPASQVNTASDHLPVFASLQMPEHTLLTKIVKFHREVPKSKNLTLTQIKELFGEQPIFESIKTPLQFLLKKPCKESIDIVMKEIDHHLQIITQQTIGMTSLTQRKPYACLIDTDITLKELVNHRHEIHNAMHALQKSKALYTILSESEQTQIVEAADIARRYENIVDDTKCMQIALKRLTKRIRNRVRTLTHEIIRKRVDTLMQQDIVTPSKLFKVFQEHENTFQPMLELEYLTENPQTQTFVPTDSRAITISEKNQLVTYYHEHLYASHTPCPQREYPCPSSITAHYLTEPISLIELKTAISKAKRGTAPGPDLHTPEILASLSDSDLELITDEMNACMQKKTIPQSWTKSLIRLLYKGTGNPLQLTNYRSISLLSCVYKLYSWILFARLKRFLDDNMQLSNLQAGFRNDKSCATHLHTLLGIYEDAKQHSNPIHVIFVDLQRAFDSVEIWTINEALEDHRVPKEFRQIIMSLYKDAKSAVIMPWGITEWFKISRGVRQGDTLSPLLFIIIMNTLLRKLEKANVGYKFATNPKLQVPGLAYADDLVLFANTRQDLNQLWEITTQFCQRRGLIINAKKSAYTTNSINASPIYVKDVQLEQLPPQTPYKYLGILIPLNLDFTQQVRKSTDNFINQIQFIGPKKLLTEQKIRAIKRVFFPKLAYQMNFIIFPDNELASMTNAMRRMLNKHIRIPGRTSSNRMTAPISRLGLNVATLHELQRAAFLHTFLTQRLNNEVVPLVNAIMRQRLIDNPKAHHMIDLGINSYQNMNRVKTTDNTVIAGCKYMSQLGWKTIASSPAACLIHQYKTLTPEFIAWLGKNQIYNTIQLLPNEKHSRLMQPRKKLPKKFEHEFDRLINTKTYAEPLGYQTYRKTIDGNNDVTITPHQPKQRHQITNQNYIIVRNKRGLPVLHLWTDGSKSNQGTGCGVFTGHVLTSRAFVPKTGDSNYIAELEAIEVALLTAPESMKVHIWTDSAAAIAAITNWDLLTQARRRKISERAAIRRITDIIKQRQELYGASTEFTHVPSHIKQKRAHYEKTDQQKLATLERKITELEREEVHQTQNIFEGNETADLLAKLATEMDQTARKIEIPKGSDPYTIFSGEKRIEMNFYREAYCATEKTRTEALEKTLSRNKRTKYIKWNQIDIEAASAPFRTALQGKASQRKQEADAVMTHAIRMQTNQLPTAKTQHRNAPIIKQTNKELGEKLEARYATPKCQHCGATEETAYHVFAECPKHRQHRQSLHEKIRKIIRDASGSDVPLPPVFAGDEPCHDYTHKINIATQDALSKALRELETQPNEIKYLANIGLPPMAWRGVLTSLQIKENKHAEITTNINWEVITAMRKLWQDSRKIYCTNIR